MKNRLKRYSVNNGSMVEDTKGHYVKYYDVVMELNRLKECNKQLEEQRNIDSWKLDAAREEAERNRPTWI